MTVNINICYIHIPTMFQTSFRQVQIYQDLFRYIAHISRHCHIHFIHLQTCPDMFHTEFCHILLCSKDVLDKSRYVPDKLRICPEMLHTYFRHVHDIKTFSDIYRHVSDKFHTSPQYVSDTFRYIPDLCRHFQDMSRYIPDICKSYF